QATPKDDGSITAKIATVSGSAEVKVVKTLGPPDIDILSPKEGATITGTATIEAWALDGDGDINSDGVVFFYKPDDGTTWTEIGKDPDADGSNNYQITWDTTAVANGKYLLRALVTDDGSFSAESMINVTVDNPVADDDDDDDDDDDVEPFVDTDNDDMDDAWEMEQFGDLSHDGTGDSDNDGLTDLEEFTAGTDPNVPETPVDDDDDDTSGTGSRAMWIFIPIIVLVLLVIIIVVFIVLRKKKVEVRIGPFLLDGKPARGSVSVNIEGKELYGDTDPDGIATITGLGRSDVGKSAKAVAIFNGIHYRFQVPLWDNKVVHPPGDWAGFRPSPTLKLKKNVAAAPPVQTADLPPSEQKMLPAADKEEPEEYHDEVPADEEAPDMDLMVMDEDDGEDVDLDDINLDDLDDLLDEGEAPAVEEEPEMAETGFGEETDLAEAEVDEVEENAPAQLPQADDIAEELEPEGEDLTSYLSHPGRSQQVCCRCMEKSACA
ncbi:MAG: hypothetical protein KJ687_11920, partial [Proteobacteria bacterium]|nr:hypothetical protein [Pseudomonadota bacterium]